MTSRSRNDGPEMSIYLGRGRRLQAEALQSTLRGLVRGLWGLLRAVGGQVARWRAARAERRQRRRALLELRSLDQRSLRDIGLGPEELGFSRGLSRGPSRALSEKQGGAQADPDSQARVQSLPGSLPGLPERSRARAGRLAA